MRTTVTLLCICVLLPVLAMAEDLRVTDADIEAVVKGNNAFAVEVYKQLRRQPGNLFFSPESISVELAMVYAGARGETATEIAKTLHFKLPNQKLHSTMSVLLHNFKVDHDGFQLNVANALWTQLGYRLFESYSGLTKTVYNADSQRLDFVGRVEQAGQNINRWIENQTQKMIVRPITPRILTLPLPPLLIATNVVYFKASWQTPFDPKKTRNEPNQYFDQASIWSFSSVKMMHRTGVVGYFDGGTFKVIELPYKGKEMSMIAFLPNAVDGLSDFEASITDANIERWISQLQLTPQVDVSLPTFKTIATFEFDDILGRMGIRRAFHPRLADFSGITDETKLFIDSGDNVASIIVKEDGTEAAAEAIMKEEQPTVAAGPPSFPIVFHATHPFVYLIRDNRTGLILFMGRTSIPGK